MNPHWASAGTLILVSAVNRHLSHWTGCPTRGTASTAWPGVIRVQLPTVSATIAIARQVRAVRVILSRRVGELMTPHAAMHARASPVTRCAARVAV